MNEDEKALLDFPYQIIDTNKSEDDLESCGDPEVDHAWAATRRAWKKKGLLEPGPVKHIKVSK